MRVLMLGFGKIGRQVAAKLVAAGYHVTAVCRSAKQTSLSNISFALGDLTQANFVATLPFASHDKLLIILAPNARNEAAYQSAFADTAKLITAQLGKMSSTNPKNGAAALPQTLFVSSTAVYGQDDGSFCDEMSHAMPEKFNGKLLLEAENTYRNCLGDRLAVVRPSGIYGLGRNYMVRKAQSMSEPENQTRWTNRIFDQDLVHILTQFALMPNPPTLCIATDNSPAKQADVLSYIRSELRLPMLVEKNTQPNSTIHKTMTGKRLVSRTLPSHWLTMPSYHSGYRAIIDHAEQCAK